MKTIIMKAIINNIWYSCFTNINTMKTIIDHHYSYDILRFYQPEKSLGCQGSGRMLGQKARILVLERFFGRENPMGKMVTENHGAFNQNAWRTGLGWTKTEGSLVEAHKSGYHMMSAHLTMPSSWNCSPYPQTCHRRFFFVQGAIEQCGQEMTSSAPDAIETP